MTYLSPRYCVLSLPVGLQTNMCAIACEHNDCVKTPSSMRRNAEVAPKCLLRSVVKRKIRDTLERALEAKERERGKKGENGE